LEVAVIHVAVEIAETFRALAWASPDHWALGKEQFCPALTVISKVEQLRLVLAESVEA